MLNEIEIENIIKSKYQDCRVNNNIFAFDIQEDKEADDNFTTYKTLSYNYDNEKVLLYEKGTIQYGEEYNVVEKYYINNNIIELKHILEIEITKKDIIDYILLSFESCSIETVENKISIYSGEIKGLIATNSYEYYILYNIINNINKIKYENK